MSLFSNKKTKDKIYCVKWIDMLNLGHVDIVKATDIAHAWETIASESYSSVMACLSITEITDKEYKGE